MRIEDRGARKWTGLAFLAFLASLFVLRAAFVGWPVLASAGVAAVFALYVLFPGWCIVRRLRPEEHGLALLMLAWMTGLAVLALVFVATCVLDVRPLIRFYPLPFVLLAALPGGRRSGPAAPLPSTSDLCACALLLVLAALRSKVQGIEEWYLHSGDEAFHAGNAAELRWRWPMQDPRLAGEPLRYHFFSYAFTCVQSLVLGTPVRPGIVGMGASIHPMGFALAAFVAARGLGARPWIAALSAAALVVHTDLGPILKDWFGVPLASHSYFDIGLYSGSSTPSGLAFLLALLYVVCGILRSEAPARGGELALAGILAFGASGSKGSVLPPLFLGLASVVALRFVVRREGWRKAFVLLAVLVACALPMTLFLVGGETSYASAMFTFEPLAAQRLSPFYETASSWFGSSPDSTSPWALLALSPLWTALFLGSGTVGLLAWLLRGERPRPLREIVLLATAVAGLLPAWLLVAPGMSQLFFSYDSQACLMLLGGVGFERAVRARGPARALLIASFAALVFLQARSVYEDLSARFLQEQPTASESSHGYQGALAWVRKNVERDAVLLVGPTWSNPSTWTERRIFFESSVFSPRVHSNWIVPWRDPGVKEPSPFVGRRELQRSILADPSPEALAEVRAVIPPGAPLYALRDDVRMVKVNKRNTAEIHELESGEPWGASVGAELVHSTPWLEVYRLP